MKYLLLVGILIFTIYFIYPKGETNKKIIDYTLENKTYHLLTARTNDELQRGLMGVRKKTYFDGMLFIFPDESFQTFWNRNTYVDLDVYWIRKGKVVGKTTLPSIEKSKGEVIVESPQPVDRVVEIIR